MRRTHLLRSLRLPWTGYRTSLSRASSSAATSRHARWQYLSLYNYTPLEASTLPDLRHQLRSGWRELDVLGRIYISQEGVNAQLIVPEHNVDRFRNSFPTLLDGAEFVYGHLFDQAASDANAGGAQPPPQLFSKLDVRVRDQIVRDGFTCGPLDLQDSGDALPPDQWHRRLQQRNDDNDSHTMVLDVRNVYEHEIGRFDGATRIMVDTFRDTFDAVDDLLEQHAQEHGGAKPANVMMYCTGGIRCEKVGAYLRQYRGIENIQKLRGGIVNYMKFLKDERAAAADDGDDAGMSESLSGPVESLFKGKNFVFDQRCVGEAPGFEDVTADVLGRCFQCGEPTSHHTNCSNLMCHGLVLQCDACAASYLGACSDGCKQEVLKMETMSPEEQRAYRKENASLWKPKNPNSTDPHLKYIKFRPVSPELEM